MNPQLNKVFSKLAKEDKLTELASQKVELGLIDDLNKALDSSEDVINGLKDDNKRILDMEKSIDGYLKARTKLKADKEKSRDKFIDLENKLSDAKQKLKEDTDILISNESAVDKRQKEIEKSEKSKAPKVKKAQNLLNIFEKNIKKAESAAKDLGLKLPIAKYIKAQDNLRKNL